MKALAIQQAFINWQLALPDLTPQGKAKADQLHQTLIKLAKRKAKSLPKYLF